MKELETKFKKKHPGLEGFKEPHRMFSWLPNAFFRLHRRRQHAENGFQPLSLEEISHFADSVLRLDAALKPLFFRAMEEADNAVLYDHYTRAKESSEAAAAKPPKPRSNRKG
jgi:hypothetical protein